MEEGRSKIGTSPWVVGLIGLAFVAVARPASGQG
jgi:hypothetical protein